MKQNVILDFLKEHFNVVDESRTPEVRIFCPFCKGGRNNDFSFDVNLEKETGRCWRAKCSWRGSFAKFLVDFLKVEYREAYKILEGKPPETVDEILGLISRLKDSVDKDLETQVDSKQERIDSWVKGAVRVEESSRLEEVSQWLRDERGYSPERFLEHHNLFIPPKFSRYKGRVLFEVTSNEDRAFIAYSMDKSLQPKTLNPGGQVLSRMLYNYNDAKKSKALFLCEGVLDTARLKSWGYSSMCVFGVAVSADQIRLLSRTLSKEIVVCFDNGAEKKAIEAAKKIAEYIPEKAVSIMLLKGEGEDPDDLSQERFEEYVLDRKEYIRKTEELVFNEIQKLRGEL